MNRYWSAVVHGLTPYVPGEQPKLPGLVKLNTNENPYGPSPRALEALRAEAADSLRLYPDPRSDRFREAVADFHGITPEQVFVGNGSDEVLAHTFLALLKHDAPLLFPDITYSFYPVYCGLYGIEFRQVPLSESFEIRVDDYLQPNGGIIFPNPNAPTGVPLALAEIERLLQANKDSVVVIDEAYIDFGGESAVALVGRYPQLLVIHTLSKSRSLAGLRVGYAVGHPALIEALNRVKDSFNSYPLDRLALAGGAAAMADRAYFEETCRKVVATRTRLAADLEALGFEVLPSVANFVFTRHAQWEGAELTAKLRERSIIVRHFKSPLRIAPFLRITVGTDAQCDALTAALQEILA
jgi:histidinol-phosphate aminotransferase